MSTCRVCPQPAGNTRASVARVGLAGGACEQERSRRRHRAKRAVSHRVMYVVPVFSTEYAMGGSPIRYSVEKTG